MHSSSSIPSTATTTGWRFSLPDARASLHPQTMPATFFVLRHFLMYMPSPPCSNITPKSGATTQVVSLFIHMQYYNDIKPDTSFYPVLKKSAGKASRLLHAHLLKLGHCHDHRVRNAIMGIYAKYGCIELARKLFDEMPDRTTADWNVIISGCWKCGDEEEARYSLSGAAQETLRLFNDMLSSGNEPDQTTWVTVLSSCSSLGEPCLAKSIVRKLDKLNFRSNYFFKTALLNMHTKCGNLEVAQKIFEQLGVYKNSVTWNAMISAYARVVDLSLARDLFNKIPERNTVSWNSMIAGYA
ncbi:hypothetical protein JHK82_040519 [Glycine max]|nr:hypothetical protein JHK85_041305 [Glycine max]KAG5111296.1 hypothetical protein JHK82_040519 [Glycine max]